MKHPVVAGVLLLTICLSCLTVSLLSGCGSSPPGPTDEIAPADSKLLLGGCRFASTSGVLTHPWLTASPTSSVEVLKGFGDLSGQTLKYAYSEGVRFGGVKTLRRWSSLNRGAEYLAQDTLGNIHFLGYKPYQKPLETRGVAGGGPAHFLLPKASALAVGATWWHTDSVEGGVGLTTRTQVMSTAATFRGKSGLLWVQAISDTDHDEAFNPNWRGPDSRSDMYYEVTHLHAVRLSEDGGYARR